VLADYFLDEQARLQMPDNLEEARLQWHREELLADGCCFPPIIFSDNLWRILFVWVQGFQSFSKKNGTVEKKWNKRADYKFSYHRSQQPV